MTLDFIISHFSWLGPWFFFLGALTEALPIIGTFLPGATIVTLGGFMAAHHYFSLPTVIAFSVIGAISGDAVSYYTGLRGGQFIRSKKIINESLLQKGEQFFGKYGNQSLLWGRFIGPIRSIIPFLSGLLKVKQSVFWFWNVTSAIIWGIFYVLIGYFSGNIFTIIIKHWNYKITNLLIATAGVIFISWLFKRYYKSGKAYQLRLYFLAVSFLILGLTFILALIFDWF